MLLILIPVFIYFLLSTLYVLVLSIAGLFQKGKNYSETNSCQRVAVLVPAYKEDGVIVSSAQHLLALNYPRDKYDVVVIADSLRQDTLAMLSAMPVKLVEVSFEKSTKAKALNAAMAMLPDTYQIAVISDADNVFEKNFLRKINAAFQHGCTVAQGRRVAKNLNSPVAVLDAYSELINNHLFRKGANALGLSSALIGSGMAFQYAELKGVMQQIDVVGGFDRALQLKLIEKGHHITYLEGAVVFDEKVSDATAFENQRRRWNSSQLRFLKNNLLKGLGMLLKGNVSYFNLSILNNVFLSRILNLGLLFILSFCLSFMSFLPQYAMLAFWLLFLGYLLALVLPVRKLPYKISPFALMLQLPKIFLLMFKSLLKVKGADQQFIHTAHYSTDIHDTVLDEYGK